MKRSSKIVVEKDIGSIVKALRADGVETIGPDTGMVNDPKASAADKAADAAKGLSIRFRGGMETMLKAMALAQNVGLAVLNVRLANYAGGGIMLSLWWEMTFKAHS